MRRHAREGVDPRHRRLHEPGAGARAGGRQAHRHLGVRLCAYEMLTGRVAFPRRHGGRTRLARRPGTREPDWRRCRRTTPGGYSHAASADAWRRRCARSACATSATPALNSPTRERHQTSSVSSSDEVPRPQHRAGLWLPRGVLRRRAWSIAIGAGFYFRPGAPQTEQLVRFGDLGCNQIPDGISGFALSPNGRSLAFVALGALG